jgi:hypothetical protein
LAETHDPKESVALDLIDLLVIEFIVKKTGLEFNTVERIYLAGKPWFTTKPTDRLTIEHTDQTTPKSNAEDSIPDPISMAETDLDVIDWLYLDENMPEVEIPQKIPDVAREAWQKILDVESRTKEDKRKIMLVRGGVSRFVETVFVKIVA